MKKGLAVLFATAVVMTSPVFTWVAAAGTAAKTIVTIQGPDGDFRGKVKSPDATCRGDRHILLFRSDNADGPFVRTGNSDTSEQQGDVGVWSMGNTGLRDGYFFAKAKATPDCARGRSPVIHLVNGVPQ